MGSYLHSTRCENGVGFLSWFFLHWLNFIWEKNLAWNDLALLAYLHTGKTSQHSAARSVWIHTHTNRLVNLLLKLMFRKSLIHNLAIKWYACVILYLHLVCTEVQINEQIVYASLLHSGFFFYYLHCRVTLLWSLANILNNHCIQHKQQHYRLEVTQKGLGGIRYLEPSWLQCITAAGRCERRLIEQNWLRFSPTDAQSGRVKLKNVFRLNLNPIVLCISISTSNKLYNQNQ